MQKKRLAVFISGFGSNLNVFLENKDHFKDILVISSNPKAYGLQRAKDFQVESHTLNSPIQWDDLHQFLILKKIDFIFLAGFMKILPPEFIKLWTGRIHNLHPSLLPAFKGLKAIERAYEAGSSIGVSIHEVSEELDSGRLILQKKVIDGEEVQKMSLKEAVEQTHKAEHSLVLEWIKIHSDF